MLHYGTRAALKLYRTMKRTLLIEIELDSLPDGGARHEELRRMILDAAENAGRGEFLFRLKSGNEYAGTSQIILSGE